MTRRTSTLLTAAFLGLLGVAAGVFVLDRFTSFSLTENTLAVACVAIGAAGLVLLHGRRQLLNSVHGQRSFAQLITGLIIALVIAAVVIRGDARSWLLVTIVVIGAVLAATTMPVDHGES